MPEVYPTMHMLEALELADARAKRMESVYRAAVRYFQVFDEGSSADDLAAAEMALRDAVRAVEASR